MGKICCLSSGNSNFNLRTGAIITSLCSVVLGRYMNAKWICWILSRLPSNVGKITIFTYEEVDGWEVKRIGGVDD